MSNEDLGQHRLHNNQGYGSDSMNIFKLFYTQYKRSKGESPGSEYSDPRIIGSLELEVGRDSGYNGPKKILNGYHNYCSILPTAKRGKC